MRHRDQGGSQHARAFQDLVFHIDRTDPLAARFDDILHPVGEMQIAVGINAAQIAGAKPAVFAQKIPLDAVIAADDPGASDADGTDGAAILRQGI
ncbi:hypothetical protein ACFOHK_00435 [Falsigemmobacter intermedius]|uniref:hypothetical protein n=1 Tax=Falsigemmobacter intermedius TaxID=1553448 RepID=UPI001F4F5188|nr:hypothetical protein [Falsigemmobacter intermedius]